MIFRRPIGGPAKDGGRAPWKNLEPSSVERGGRRSLLSAVENRSDNEIAVWQGLYYTYVRRMPSWMNSTRRKTSGAPPSLLLSL